MYCPLCKAEYREGFIRCSDCKIDLVQRYEEVQAIRVVQLWEETSLSKFNTIVAALDDANIPNRAESSASPNSGMFIKVLGFFIVGKRQNLAWKVSVLETDYVAATAIAEKFLN